jgi:integrase/recombinase XerD
LASQLLARPRVALLFLHVSRRWVYLEVAGRLNASPDAPLFTGGTKGDHSTEQGISDKLIERVVKQYAPAGIDITPHGLRASFVTIALESGAKLHQVQYAAGHADPRTTERYQKRKMNLDDNAVGLSVCF